MQILWKLEPGKLVFSDILNELNADIIPAIRKNIRHLFPMLCLTIRLHSHSAIYFSILFVFYNFIHFLIVVAHISLFIALYTV